jgi:site-specific recombinase XerD
MTKAKNTGSGESSPRRHGITVITEPTAEELAERQISDYRAHREKSIKWVLNFGKDPDRGEGYAETTADIRCARVDKFYRWVWEQNDGYTTRVSHEHADTYMRELAYSDASQDTKANMMKALKTLFRWRGWEFDEDEWDPELTFSNDTSTTNPRAYSPRSHHLSR